MHEPTLAFTANGLQTSYAKVARGCYIFYGLLATKLDRLLCKYWVTWCHFHVEQREVHRKNITMGDMAHVEKQKQNALGLQLVMRTWESRLRLAQTISLVAWRQYNQVRKIKGRCKRSKLDDAFQRDVALQSVQTYAGEHKQLQDNLERLRFLNATKDAQIDQLKQAVELLQSEQTATEKRLAVRTAQIDHSELLNSQLDDANAANRSLQQQCLHLQRVATDEKAKVAESKERQRTLEAQLTQLLQSVESSDQASQPADTLDSRPTPATPKTKVTLAGGKASSSVGGRWSLPTVGVASYRNVPQEGLATSPQAAQPPTLETENEIKQLEAEKSQALQVKDYKRAHMLLKQLETMPHYPLHVNPIRI